MKKVYYVFIMAIISWGCTKPLESKQMPDDYPLSSVDIKRVVINDDFWLPKISVLQDSTIQFAFDKCKQEGRMDNFLIAGGQLGGNTKGHMPFDDTDLYKIIEGTSTSLISKPNPALERYLDSIIEVIKVGQEPDGYLTTWFTIDRENPPASWVKPSKSRWENEISSHELYNSGHLFEAAATHYWATGKRNFLDIAIKNADLLVENFGPGKLNAPPGHQIVETGLIKLFRITNNENYLKLSKFFLDARGNSATHDLYGEYSQDHLPVTQQKEAVGHAVRAVYMYAGMTDVAAMYKDTSYHKAVMGLWDNVVTKKMYLTGGIGSTHNGEAFGQNYQLPNATAYNETCAAVGNVYWNHRLFLLTGDVKYYDIIERTLYNGLISGISLNGKKFFYPNPLESDGKYMFNYGVSCTRAPWFDCSCCPTNMIRFLPSISGLIYAKQEDTLYVNLYIANNSKVSLKSQEVEMQLETNYPWDGKTTLTLNPVNKTPFTLKLRVPGWARNEVIPSNLYHYAKTMKEDVLVLVNGIKSSVNIENGYVEIRKEWSKGDKVEIEFPMEIRKVIANELVEEDLNKIAFEYGPLVYCAEEVDNPDLSTVKIKDGDSIHITQLDVLTDRVNALKIVDLEKELTLIPYYIWSNRGVNAMKVWLPTN